MTTAQRASVLDVVCVTAVDDPDNMMRLERGATDLAALAVLDSFALVAGAA